MATKVYENGNVIMVDYIGVADRGPDVPSAFSRIYLLTVLVKGPPIRGAEVAFFADELHDLGKLIDEVLTYESGEVLNDER